MAVHIKKLNTRAVVPTQGSCFAAGYDVYSVEDTNIPARGKAIIGTGIAIGMPAEPPMYCRVAPRSGLAAKYGIAVGAGVIDRDYTGEVRVVLFNHSDEDMKVCYGDRIAQLVFEVIYKPTALVCVDELPETSRGTNGFGSTG